MDQVVEAGWRNAFEVMKTNYSLTDDAIGVFAINLRFNLDDIQTIVSEAITGGGDDKKCDVLYVDKEREIAVIAQCYISQKIREAAPANKASDLNTALTWLLSTNLDNLSDALKGRADELRSAINAGEIKQFYVWYVHNLPCSKNVQDEIQAADFRSTDAIQERLRTEFDAIPDAEYEGGRRGGASDAIKRTKFTLPSYTVGQSLAAFHGDPVTAYDKKSELWTNERNYRQIFTDRTTARHIVFCYSLLAAVNDRKLELSQKQKNDPSPPLFCELLKRTTFATIASFLALTKRMAT
jgi:hypothetical protein